MNSNAQKRKIVACIPAYNEERTIASVIVKTVKYVNEVMICDDAPKLIVPILSGEADIVIGSRFIINNDSKCLTVYRKFEIKMMTKIVKTISYSDVTDAQSGFRAYNKRAIESINIIILKRTI